MAGLRFQCPKCRTTLKAATLPKSGQIRCPDCDTLFAVEEEAPASGPRQQNARDDEDYEEVEEKPRRGAPRKVKPRKKSSGSWLTIGLILGVAAVVLFLTCGVLGIGGFYLYNRGSLGFTANPLVGKWTDGQQTWEFRSDGSTFIQAGGFAAFIGKPIQGHYRLLEKDLVEIQLPGGPPVVYRVDVTATELHATVVAKNAAGAYVVPPISFRFDFRRQ